MRRRKLGSSDLEVSNFALGTMTFGEQNTAAEAAELLDQACAGGVNFIDTAEMYPAPARAETYGDSERFIGAWLRRRGRRDDLVIATKASGPGAYVGWIRDGRSSHTAANLEAAVDASLARLGTDYIDLFQLHWPDRATNFFGQLGFKPAAHEQPFDPAATLAALAALVASGKIRHFGVCNETPWGTQRLVELARANNLPAPVSVQNPYNLLNRTLEVGLSEVLWREQLALIAYSPLAFGMLTGKYLDDAADRGARLNRFSHYKRYRTERARLASSRYVAVARDAGIDPAHMALAWCASKPAVASVIIGATNRTQLAHNLAASELKLPRAVDKAIDAVHEEIPNPCP